MILRKYRLEDCKSMAELFYETVHSVNAADYTPEQLNVWATGKVDLEAWDKSRNERGKARLRETAPRIRRYRQHRIPGQAVRT